MLFPWKKKTSSAATNTSDHTSGTQPSTAERLQSALNALNAKVQQVDNMPDDDDVNSGEIQTTPDKAMRFRYQNTDFLALYNNGSPYINVVMEHILRTETANLNEVRFLCNQTTSPEWTCHGWYTLSDNAASVSVMVRGSVSSYCDSAQTLAWHLDKLISHMFAYRNEFLTSYHELLHQRGESEPYDFEASISQRLRKVHLMRMAETNHSGMEGITEHSSDHAESATQIPTLQQFLEAAHGIQPNEIKSVTVASDTDAPRRLSGEEIDVYGLFNDIWPEATRRCFPMRLAHKWIILRVEVASATQIPPHGLVTITLSDYGKDARNGYIDAVSTFSGADPIDGVAIGSPAWEPRTVRTVLSVTPGTGDGGHSEFDYMLSDAREKALAGQDAGLSAEQRLLLRAFISDTGYHLYHGTAHFNAGRYLQAAVLLGCVFDDMLPRYANMDDAARESFLEVCFMLGFCNVEFKRFDRAFYYLSITVNNGNFDHDREYINCLVNAGDYRAAELIEHVLEEFESYSQRNDISDNALEMYHFLRRRKVYLFVESGRLDEAEAMLRDMVDEEPNREFAIGELAHIKRLREK